MADGNNKLAEIMARKKAARAAASTDAPVSREGSGNPATMSGHVRQSSTGALQPNCACARASARMRQLR